MIRPSVRPARPAAWFPPWLAGWCLWWLLVGAAGAQTAPLTWRWSNPYPHGNDVLDMVNYNGTVVQVTDSGQVYTTDDLNLWLPRNSQTSNTFQAVTQLGNRLIAVGANGTVVWSDDGINFTTTNLSTPNSDWLTGVAASATLAVAVGDEAIVYTSKDGAGWAPQGAPPNVGGNWLRGITYGGGLFVMAGEGGYLASSPDGTNWTRRTLPSPYADDLNCVAYVSTPGGNAGFATATYLSVSDQGRGFISTNGVTWSLLFNTGTSGGTNLFTIAGNLDRRLFAGADTLFLENYVTTKIVAFAGQTGAATNTAPAWGYYCSLNYSNSFLAAGQSGLTVQGTNQNGYVWPDLNPANRSWLWQVVWSPSAALYVAVGNQATIMTSGNGVDWDVEAVPNVNSVSPTNTIFFGVGGSSNQLVAVGSGGTIVLSTNAYVATVTTNADGTPATNLVSSLGVLWNPLPPPTTNDLHAVAWFGNQFYVAGGGGTILRSPNGVAWSKVPTPSTAYLSGLEVFPGGLVAVGNQGTILTSPNGANWTVQTSGTTNWLLRVHYLGGRLFAVGDNGTILTSANGAAWQAQTSGVGVFLNDLAQVANAVYVVGNQGTLLRSTNGVNWSPLPMITGNSLFSAATQNGQLVVAGTEGNILRSQVVPITTPVPFLSFAHTPAADLFLVGGQADQQFTLDSSTNLVDWTTGPRLNFFDSSGTLEFYLPNSTNAPGRKYYRNTLANP